MFVKYRVNEFVLSSEFFLRNGTEDNTQRRTLFGPSVVHSFYLTFRNSCQLCQSKRLFVVHAPLLFVHKSM
jgi:hypothetical protein